MSPCHVLHPRANNHGVTHGRHHFPHPPGASSPPPPPSYNIAVDLEQPFDAIGLDGEQEGRGGRMIQVA
jgi:hypothetical protein